jgi:thiamine biosynthesis lipoprotein
VCSLNTLLASASTSGNGERARLVAGRIVGHILDARDGSMAHSRGSVTVLASSALLADALSTGLCVLGPEEGLRAVQELPEVEAVFVEELADGRLRVHATERARRRISRLDPHAELAPQPRISTPSPVPVR